MVPRSILLLFAFWDLVAPYATNVDCTFETDLCGWKAIPSARLFHADAVPLGAAGSIRGDGKFVFIQSSASSPDQSEIRFSSPVIESSLSSRSFDFAYWKSSPQTKIDVCLQSAGGPFRCIDAAPAEVTQRHWFTHSLSLPPSFSPFSIVFRIRNALSAADIVAIDNIIFAKPREDEAPKPGANFFPKDFRDLKIKQIRPNSRLPVNKIPIGRPAEPSSSIQAGRFVNNIRVSPAEEQQVNPNVCDAVRCNFLGTKCLWRFDRGWRLQDGNIAIEGDGNGTAMSGLFKVPVGAFLEMDLWVSDKTSLIVSQSAHLIDRIIYSGYGLSHNGWHRIRVPMKPSYDPVEVKIQAFLEGEANNFATVSRTRLVDLKGSELPCEVEGKPPRMAFAVSQIRPNQTLQRLTALQSVKEVDVPLPRRPLAPTPSPLGFSGPSPPVFLPHQPSLGSFPSFASLGLAPASLQAPPAITLPPMIALLPQTSNPLPSNSQIAALFSDPQALQALLSKGNLPPSIGDFVSKISSQPALESQLRNLAQRFGFANLSAEKALELFKQITSSGPKTVGKTVHLPKSPLSDLPPIRPVNADDKDFEVIQKDEEIRPAPEERLKSALTNRLSSFIQLPQASDNQLPLQRKNLDFVIENAWRAREEGIPRSEEVESERII
ncbi:hypothetical protein L596_007974 [Steinernema carpocapsae]|uniref:MAM domain-containing protein n=1 Tax=Steinernema carpocapsae TaxID=34508 RepID=A0A4U5PB54_STECR|nr:hypothetical protein L596_007974 [Steinernema carpocapsae]